MSRERLGRIGDLFEADIGRGLLPGAVALVARRGRVVHFKAYGRRDPGAEDPMALDAIFRIYSMTKPIISVLAMMLVEEGRLGFADPLSSYIPAFGTVQVAEIADDQVVGLAAPLRAITIQDLLRHTSGLTYEWLDGGPVGRLYAEANLGRRTGTNADHANAIAALPLVCQPGSRWEYSRSTDVLGRVIEVVTGRALGAHLDAALLEPLGMLETGFHVPEAFHARIAEPHPADPDTGEPVQLLDLRRASAFEGGGGGLASTAGDYARFLHMIASGGTLDGVRLLSPASLAFMLADHLGPDVAIGSDLMPGGYGFGLGFAVRRAHGLAPYPGSIGDCGWQGLGGTSFWIDPAERLYGLLMIQAPGRLEHYLARFRCLVYGAVAELTGAA